MSDTPIEDSIKALHYERTRKKEPPPWWPAVEAILNEHGLQAIDFVADFKAAMKQGEPVAKYIGETPYGGSEVQLYEDLKKGTELYAAALAAQPTCKQDLQVPTVKESLSVETEQERYVRMCPDIECGRKKKCTRMVGFSCMSRADIAPAEQSDDKDLLTIAFMDGHAKGKAAALVQQGEQKARADLEAEMQEQCRIIGMGGQREVKLLAENERLRATLLNLLAYANGLEMHDATVNDEHHAMQAARAALGEKHD